MERYGEIQALWLCQATRLRLMLRMALLAAFLFAGTTLNSVATQTRELQGTVSVGNEAGERLPGANLSLTSTFAARTARSTVTNDQGEYKFTDLAAGVYTLHVTLNGFKEHNETITKGHFGLAGMRERAERIGSKFTLVSSPGSGTVITLVVPGRIVFRNRPAQLGGAYQIHFQS